MADSHYDLRTSSVALPQPSTRILNSWKEIASYLGRGIRTIQRYEEKLGLPVHRPARRERSAVVAFADELERWLKECSESHLYTLKSDERQFSRNKR